MEPSTVSISSPLPSLWQTPARTKGSLGFPKEERGSPSREQKSRAKVKRLRSLNKSSSLSDDKILLQTKLVRSQSTFGLLEQFQIQEVISSSAHSEVYKAMHRDTGQLFAVKRLNRKFTTKSQRERCMHEMQAVACLSQHPNIVSYYRAWQQAAYFYIQMALCEGGDLAKLLKKVSQENIALSEQKVYQMLSDMAEGLEFLRENDIVHLDVKPENIFLDVNGRCKIGDFGLAVKDHEKEWEEGDGDYLAPELLSSEDPSFAADIYSAGATIFECCTGIRYASVKSSGTTLDWGMSSALQNLVMSMLHEEPSSRPTARDILAKLSVLCSSDSDHVVSMDMGPSLPGSSLPPGGFALRPFQTLELMIAVQQAKDFLMKKITWVLLNLTHQTFAPVTSLWLMLQRHQQTQNLRLCFQDEVCSIKSPFWKPLKPSLATTPSHFEKYAMRTPTIVGTAEDSSNSQEHPKEITQRFPSSRLEDTAFRQPVRSHWSRKGTHFLASENATFAPQDSEDNKSQHTETVLNNMEAMPFTALGCKSERLMKSPFEEMSHVPATSHISMDHQSDSPLSWLAKESFSSAHSIDQSPCGSTSSTKMEELHSTVRLLQMSAAE